MGDVSSRWALLRQLWAPFVLAIVVMFVLAPGLQGYFGRDDFAQLAYMRMIGSPWPLFVHDHFFAAGSVFRPLGFAALWLSQKWCGIDYAAHTEFGVLLHAGVAVALYSLIRTTALPRWAALACVSLFALHPVAAGTALWWSARFDVVAALFVLLSLRAGFAYLGSGGAIALAGCAVLALAAALAKETGLAVLVPLVLIALHRAWTDAATRRRATGLILAAVAVAAVYFAWRWLVLGTLTSRLTDAQAPLDEAARKGVSDWLRYSAGYLGFWTRYSGLQQGLGVLAALALGAGVALGWRSRTDARGPALLLGGLAVLLVPGLLQAPVVAANGAPLEASASAVEVAMQSRLYYLSLAGAVLALSAVMGRFWSPRSATVLGVGLVLGALTVGWAGRGTAEAHAQRSREISTVAPAVARAVSALELPRERCHVFLLGTTPPPEWGVFVSMDSVVKALAPDPARLGHCFVHADYKTIFYVMARGIERADALPFLPRENKQGAIPWLGIGDTTLAYLRYEPERVLPDSSGMLFLRYEDGVFRDVGAEVAAGRIVVKMP